MRGTYVSVEPFHLFRHLDEQVYRHTERRTTDSERFTKATGQVEGQRLTHKRLIGKQPEARTFAVQAGGQRQGRGKRKAG